MSGDNRLPMLADEIRAEHSAALETKARKSGEGFKTLETWPGGAARRRRCWQATARCTPGGSGASPLFLVRDRADPLVVLTWATDHAMLTMDLAKAYYEQKKRLLNAAIEECGRPGPLAREEAAPPADDGGRLELEEEFVSGRAGALRHELEEGPDSPGLQSLRRHGGDVFPSAPIREVG